MRSQQMRFVRQYTSGTEFTVTEVFRNLNAIQNGASPYHTSVPGQNTLKMKTKVRKNRIRSGESIQGTISFEVIHQNLTLNSIQVDLIFNVYTPGVFLERKNRLMTRKNLLKKSKTLQSSSPQKDTTAQAQEMSHGNNTSFIFNNRSGEIYSQKNEEASKSSKDLSGHFHYYAEAASKRKMVTESQLPEKKELFVEVRKRFEAFSLQQPRLRRNHVYQMPFEISLDNISLFTLSGDYDPMDESKFLEKEDKFSEKMNQDLRIECFLQVSLIKNTGAGPHNKQVERKSDPIQIFVDPKTNFTSNQQVQIVHKNPRPPKNGFLEKICGLSQNPDIRTHINKTVLRQNDPEPLKVTIKTGGFDISDYICCNVQLITTYRHEENVKEHPVFEKSLSMMNLFHVEIPASSLSPFAPTLSCETLSFSSRLLVIFEEFQGEDLKVAEIPIELLSDTSQSEIEIPYCSVPKFNKFTHKEASRKESSPVLLPFSKFAF